MRIHCEKTKELQRNLGRRAPPPVEDADNIGSQTTVAATVAYDEGLVMERRDHIMVCADMEHMSQRSYAYMYSTTA